MLKQSSRSAMVNVWLINSFVFPLKIINAQLLDWGRTGLVVRALDSGSGDPGSILGRVGVLFPLARDIYSPKVLVIPRNRWLRLNMTEKLFTGTLNQNQNKTKQLLD